MLEDRELLFPELLRGEIVKFTIKPVNIFPYKRYAHVLRVMLIEHGEGGQPGYIKGDVIASNWNWYQIRVLKEKITDYKILTKIDLPLLIGYKYKAPLLDELIRGGESG